MYTVIGMDVAAEFTMGIWVDAKDMATVGARTGFTGADVVGVVGKGWAITPYFVPLFAVLWFSSSYQPFWVLGPFWLMGCYFGEDFGV